MFPKSELIKLKVMCIWSCLKDFKKLNCTLKNYFPITVDTQYY